MVAYQGHIIPIVIAVYIMSFIENKLHKIVPEMIDLFVTPLVTVFITGYLTLTLVGPVFVFFIDWSSTNSSITIWDRWVYNWWNICNYSCYRYSSYVFDNRYGSNCQLWIYILVANSISCKYSTRWCNTCSRCKN